MNMNLNDEELKNISFTTVNSQGIEVECDVLKSYYDEETNKLYVAFTDYTLNENDNIKIFLTEVVGDGTNFKLKDVEDTKLRQKLLNDVFNNLE